MRHPDLQPSNVIVSTSSDSTQLKIVGLLDWQRASILPPFLLAGIPAELRWPGLAGSHPTLTAREHRPAGPIRAEPRDGTLPPPSRPLPLCTTSSITIRCRAP